MYKNSYWIASIKGATFFLQQSGNKVKSRFFKAFNAVW